MPLFRRISVMTVNTITMMKMVPSSQKNDSISVLILPDCGPAGLSADWS